MATVKYQPDRAKWEARTARRLAADPSLLSTPLPAGFPKKLESPLVWDGSDWKDEKDWVYALTPRPACRGFSVPRGIPVGAYSREELVIIYAGMSSYIGNFRVQNNNTGGCADPYIILGQRTNFAKLFHTDGGDIVSLLALETAAEGGVSRISSSWRVYNHIAEHRPDLIETLSQPWPFDGFRAEYPCILRPLLGYVDDKLIIQYGRRSLTGFQGQPRSANIPPISEAQAEALDTLHFLAEKYALGLDFQKGDIQYVNNLSIFHARDGFRTTRRICARHLLWLWLCNEELGWDIPEYLNANRQRLYYSLDPEKQAFALEPEIRSPKGVMYQTGYD
ncbi:Clavaminate synthase-like protein [Athelia psychrophila]|uniref:Clavaminate synthase-like protein n=1 Tax=Athelia psychrophila TaxID=1759441 RepID=A0A166STE8_9AGAM|nr:Clavaminate synthase-like protein [Fibularhizoctonia sp. CBS 109695]